MKENSTALYHISNLGRKEIVEMLLRMPNIDVNIQDIVSFCVKIIKCN